MDRILRDIERTAALRTGYKPSGASALVRAARSVVGPMILSIVGMSTITGEGVAQDAASDRVVVTTIDEGEMEGVLQSLGESVELSTADGTIRQIARTGVISVRPADAPECAADPDALVLLVNDDVLGGTTLSASEDAIVLNWTGTDPPTPLTIPLEFVRSIVLSQPTEPIERHRLQRMWGLTTPGTDRLILSNGTYADGEISGLNDTSVLLSTNLGSVNTARAEVAAAMMSAELAADPELPTDYAVLVCNDGSRITLDGTSFNAEEGFAGRLVGSVDVQLPLDRIVHVQLFGERVSSLADRTPADYVFTPYLIERHPLVRHRNVHGGPLRVRGSCCATGLGVHSKSDVTYDLAGEGYRSLTATIGVDDMADGQGNVVFTVSVDGEVVFESGGITGSDEPVTVGPIDIAEAKQLTLSVDYGARGNIRDIADWCNPLLLK